MAMNSSMVPKKKVIDFNSIVRNLPVDLPEQRGRKAPHHSETKKTLTGRVLNPPHHSEMTRGCQPSLLLGNKGNMNGEGANLPITWK
jgi:hypothetical protein